MNTTLYNSLYLEQYAQWVIVTSLFGDRWGTIHNGEDTANRTPGTKMGLHAPVNCQVLFAGRDSYSGALFVELLFPNGDVFSLWHMDSFDVWTGQQITRGQFIGMTGNTGFSTGVHLHISIYRIENRVGIWQRGLNFFFNPATYDMSRILGSNPTIRYTNKQPTQVWISDVMRPGENTGRLDINTKVEVRRVSGNASECWVNGFLHGWVANVDLSVRPTNVTPPPGNPRKYTNKQPTRVWTSDVMRPGEDKGRLDINTQVEVRRTSGAASECWVNGYLHGWVANVDLSNEKTVVQQPEPTPPKDDCATQLEVVKKERDALKTELEKFSPISNAYIKNR